MYVQNRYLGYPQALQLGSHQQLYVVGESRTQLYGEEFLRQLGGQELETVLRIANTQSGKGLTIPPNAFPVSLR